MTRQEKIGYFRIALSLQKISISDEISDRLIETLEALEKKGGKFTLHDAVDIEMKMNRKYAEKDVAAS